MLFQGGSVCPKQIFHHPWYSRKPVDSSPVFQPSNMKFHGTENTQNVINVHFLVKCLHKTNMNFKRSSCHVLCTSPGSISRIT